MMPDYNVLVDESGAPYCIEQDEVRVNLSELLLTLNKRIAALYDREHTLGHAFFIPIINEIRKGNHQAALVEIGNCFQNKIIPLLSEYFFEDWQKVRLVLGDNQKEQSKATPLIKKLDVEFESLFGDTDDLEVMDDELHDYQLIKIDSKLWEDALTYVGMYDTSQLDG
jgi:5-methylcytosine-specific restriction protein B